jgi:hypothetical protein
MDGWGQVAYAIFDMPESISSIVLGTARRKVRWVDALHIATEVAANRLLSTIPGWI